MLISPDGVAPSRIVGVSTSVVFPCTTKSRRIFLLAPAHSGSPRKRDVKRLCVCPSTAQTHVALNPVVTESLAVLPSASPVSAHNLLVASAT